MVAFYLIVGSFHSVMYVCVFSAEGHHELVEEASSRTAEPGNAEAVRHDSLYDCYCSHGSYTLLCFCERST